MSHGSLQLSDVGYEDKFFNLIEASADEAKASAQLRLTLFKTP
ncbi:MAG: hypothetical protein WCS01_02665 [bacterium]